MFNRKQRRELKKHLGENFPIDRLLAVYNAYYVVRGMSVTEMMIDMLYESTCNLDNAIADAYNHSIGFDDRGFNSEGVFIEDWFNDPDRDLYPENFIMYDDVFPYKKWDGEYRA